MERGVRQAPRLEVGEPLPGPVEEWIRRFGWSAVESAFRPNKHELLLHLSLLENRADRWRVVRRRLAPLRLPGPIEGPAPLPWWLRLRRGIKYGLFLAHRMVHHARLLAPTLWSLARWSTLADRKSVKQDS